MKMRLFFSISLIILLLLQLHIILLAQQYPFYGITTMQGANRNWEITGFNPPNEALPSELQVGETIVLIDGLEPNRHSSLKLAQVEQFHTIDVMQNHVQIHIDMSSVPNAGKWDFVSITGSLICLLFLVFILWKLPPTHSKHMLIVLFFAIAFIFTSISGSGRADRLAASVICLGISSLSFLFLLFLHILFREKHISIRIPFLVPICALPVLNFIICTIVLFSDSPYWVRYLLGSISTIIVFLIGIIFNLAYLAVASFRYYRRQQSYEATLIRTIWTSLCISLLPLALLSLLPSIVLKNYVGFVDPIYTGCFVLFFPASFAYLIGTNQLYDIQLVLRRLGIAAVISLVPSTLLVGLVRLLAPQLPIARLLVLLLLGGLVFTFLLYALEFFTTKLEPVMFPRRHQLGRSLGKIAKRLGPISNLRELRDAVLVDLVSTLQVHGGAIVFRYADGSAESIKVGAIDSEKVERLVEEGAVEHPHYSMFEINRHEEYAGYLIMTRKKTNTLLSLEEVQWLHLIITYLSVTLENIHLIRKLTAKVEQMTLGLEEEPLADHEWRWLRKLTFELQEKERTRIANDLHDTTMQDLYFMKRRLVGLLGKGSLRNEDATEVEDLAEFIEIVNMNLRQNCFELHPHLLKEAGLSAALEKLVELEGEASEFAIKFAAEEAEPAEALDLDAKRHVFRIVQELINNAKKHSQASAVTLRLHADETAAVLVYTDDGIGFDPAGTHLTATSGIGLEQIRSRVAALNGELELDAGRGRGVRCLIRLPLPEPATP